MTHHPRPLGAAIHLAAMQPAAIHLAAIHLVDAANVINSRRNERTSIANTNVKADAIAGAPDRGAR